MGLLRNSFQQLIGLVEGRRNSVESIKRCVVGYSYEPTQTDKSTVEQLPDILHCLSFPNIQDPETKRPRLTPGNSYKARARLAPKTSASRV